MFVRKPPPTTISNFDSVTFQEFQDTHKIDPFYYDFAGDLLTPYRAIYEYGPWIAGGFFSRAIQGETLENFRGDVDIWFHTQEQVAEYVDGLDSNRFCLNAVKAERYKSHYSYSYIIPYKGRDFKIQLISYKTFNNIDVLLDRFDTFHSMIGTDGVNVYYERDAAIKCAKNKILYYNWDYILKNASSMPDARLVLMRYSKFIANGYTISNGQTEKFVKLIKDSPMFNNTSDNTKGYGNI